ncbi:hypothetical protein [Micromonospora chokoriensis]|uniref:Uncharacterized protein n=1 Tax=Micromonospora chokoriensis TaxID=356851 RepID=A0A1C4U5W3_9ACTN|nr:hypothetical protein [Micromonospora chokoriensis]SCE67061.1 hypothetical protein GA0070612_0116 [Micromonospora chokoriensis]
MIRFRTILATGLTAAATVTLFAGPAQADSVSRHAHAHFDGDGSMFVDVTRPAVGDTVVDVEWHKSACGVTDGVYGCDSVSRSAYDVPVTRFSFSLTDGAKLTATVPYRESRQHCDVVDGDEICGERQESTGSTVLKVTWVPNGEPLERERWTAEDGTVHISTSTWTTVSGSGFGSAYDDPASSFGKLSRSRSIPPAA